MFIEFIHEVRSATRLHIEKRGKFLKFIKYLKGVGLNGGV